MSHWNKEKNKNFNNYGKFYKGNQNNQNNVQETNIDTVPVEQSATSDNEQFNNFNQVAESVVTEETVQKEEKPVSEIVKETRNEHDNWKWGSVYNATLLNLREQPTKDSKVITTLPKDTELQFTSTSDEKWVKVKINGKIGYCMAEYILDAGDHTGYY